MDPELANACDQGQSQSFNPRGDIVTIRRQYWKFNVSTKPPNASNDRGAAAATHLPLFLELTETCASSAFHAAPRKMIIDDTCIQISNPITAASPPYTTLYGTRRT
jgi:hypothetical protein